MSGRDGEGPASGAMPRSVQILVGVLAVIALAGTVAFTATFREIGARSGPVPSAAAAPQPVCADVPLVVDPTIASAVETIVAAIPAADLGCSTLSVTPRDSGRAFSDLTTAGTGPTLWIPDSREWLGRASGAGSSVVELGPSIASTPVVTVSASAAQPTNWSDMLADDGVLLGNPAASAVSNAPVVAMVVEAHARGEDAASVAEKLVPALRTAVDDPATSGSTGRIEAVATSGGTAVATEQAFEVYRSTHPDTVLSAWVPASHSVFMDYPLAAVGSGDSPEAASPAVAEAGRVLAQALSSPTGRSVLSGSGFRSPDRDRLGVDGVGWVEMLPRPDPEYFSAVVAQSQLLMRPLRALAVVDVSGSMDYVQDGVTRMTATSKAGADAIEFFPPDAQLGLWAFSIELGDGTDYRQLEPVRRMDAPEGQADHRAALLAQVNDLPALVGGGTGLYDTVIAAYRALQHEYDPGSINVVILLTDGANDDSASISRQELLDTLTAEQDPMRPVHVVTIGVSHDADTDILEQISEVTGGRSYFAQTPADIPTVFADAINARIG
ncbi:hypothetical protein ABH922_000628 [Rhodococcus sp. 27YEA15]|uniref:VWA domain-containing protein n=1 Tax=Rhodococcus sp. 27YEA15 TaxID=3156259 RepID=UPI003C7BCFCA